MKLIPTYIGYWQRLCMMARDRQGTIHRVQGLAHLSYFYLVATQGAYYWPAGVCFVIGAAAFCLRIEEV